MKTFKQHIVEKLKVSTSYSDIEEKISNRRSKTTIKDELSLTLPYKLHFKAWVDDMIVVDDFVTVEPLDSLISFLPKNEGVFWNYNFRNGTKPEIIDGIVIDGSMTFGEAYEVILRFIHDKYEDKDDIFTI